MSAGVIHAAAFSGWLSWGTVVHLRATSPQQENLDFPIAAPKSRFLESKSRNVRPLKGYTQNSVPSAAVLLVGASHRTSPDSGREERDFTSQWEKQQTHSGKGGMDRGHPWRRGRACILPDGMVIAMYTGPYFRVPLIDGVPLEQEPE